MTESSKRWLTLSVPVLVVVALDQVTKYWIRFAPDWQRASIIDGVFDFTYIRNSGMALGIDLFDTWIVGLISIVATLFISIVTVRTMKEATLGYLFFMGCIIGGALGNIVDRIFLARIEGYGTWLEGHVVDFLHFSLEINDWAVFPYIFNVADAFISVSVVVLLLFHKRLMPEPPKPEASSEAPLPSDSASPESN